MKLTRVELSTLWLPILGAVAMVTAGWGLIWTAKQSLDGAQQLLLSAQQERSQNAQRLARTAEEEREVRARLAVYHRLKELNVLGEERRLEWADAIARIRAKRELLDLRYRVERQVLLSALGGKNANVEFYASAMKVDLSLLHEEDLLRFLGDLRASGNAYYAVRKCSLERLGQTAAPGGIAPQLRAGCEIDLITIVDRGARP